MKWMTVSDSLRAQVDDAIMKQMNRKELSAYMAAHQGHRVSMFEPTRHLRARAKLWLEVEKAHAGTKAKQDAVFAFMVAMHRAAYPLTWWARQKLLRATLSNIVRNRVNQ